MEQEERQLEEKLKNHKHEWMEAAASCPRCGLDLYLECLICGKSVDLDEKELEDFPSVPMGVSQWREYGKKYGYWEYFEKETNKPT
jgi:hypothetical protein